MRVGRGWNEQNGDQVWLFEVYVDMVVEMCTSIVSERRLGSVDGNKLKITTIVTTYLPRSTVTLHTTCTIHITAKKKKKEVKPHCTNIIDTA